MAHSVRRASPLYARPMPNSIDVVVVAYNRFALTESCLRHLKLQTVDHHVIVVDNGSTDETRARLRSEWPDVQLVCIEENQHFSKACNLGVAAGTGDVVALLNNDVDCRPNYLECLTLPLQDARVGSVSALLLQRDGERIDGIGFTVDATLSAFSRLQGQPAAHADRDVPTLLGPGGGAAAYRRTAWNQVGGLDEAFLFYMEDVDIALRLRTAGWRAAAAPDAVAVHLRSGTLGGNPRAQRHGGGFGRGYMLRRYGLLRSRHAVRTVATEVVAVLGDMALYRDLTALRGRLTGWRVARTRPRVRLPPADAIDSSIGIRHSLAQRWRVHAPALSSKLPGIV